MQTMELAPIRKQIAGAEMLNLLIMDDEKAVRESCREAVQINGFNTFTFSYLRQFAPSRGERRRQSLQKAD